MTRSLPARARRFAATLEDPTTRATAAALIYAHARGDNGKSRRLFRTALDLDPDSDALKLAILSNQYRGYMRGDPELDALAASMNDPYAAIVEGWKLAEEPDGAALQALLPRISACQPADSCFLSALRLRAVALLASGDPQEAREALALMDRYGALLQVPHDKLLRARAAVAAEQYPAALSLAHQLDFRQRQDSPAARQLAREVLAMLESIPPDSLDESGQRLQAAFRRAATGPQRGVRAR